MKFSVVKFGLLLIGNLSFVQAGWSGEPSVCARTIALFRSLVSSRNKVNLTPALLHRTIRFETDVRRATQNANERSRKAYQRIRSRYDLLVSRNYRKWSNQSFEDLEASAPLIEWLSLNTRSDAHKREIAEFYLSLFEDPDFDNALAELGRTFREIHHPEVESDFWAHLSLLRYVFMATRKKLDAEILRNFTQEFGGALKTNSPQRQARITLEALVSDWALQLNERGAIDNIRDIETSRLVQRAESLTRKKAIERAFPRLKPRQKELIFPLAVRHFSDRTAEILSKLLSFRWFVNFTPEDQRLAFFVLNFAAYRAQNTQNRLQKEVLTAAIEIVLEGNLPIKFSDLGEKINGGVHTDFIVLSNRWANSDPSFFEDHQGEELSLNAFPHEVAHILSGVRKEESAQYFEEEYRAWMVGYVGRYGQVPIKREALARMAYLISPNGAYTSIRRAWSRDPKSFFRYFKEFGFQNPDELLRLTDARLLGLLRENPNLWDEAPQWGWEGFLTLKRPPKDWPRSR